MTEGIDRLILCSPYEEPKQHWHYDPAKQKHVLTPGRRPAGYLLASNKSEGEWVDIPLVNEIRDRLREWRQSGYSGVSSTTKRLLDHWREGEDFANRLFFCQLEAIETLIWLIEAPAHFKDGIDVPPSGGDFQRLCAKMATGTGKTVVMAMLIAWQVLNKVDRPHDERFCRNVLAIAPGLTVRDRLAVLDPNHPQNYYDEFDLVPMGWQDKLRRGQVLIRNWHALAWETDTQLARKRSVDKRGAKSDKAWTREVLGEIVRDPDLNLMVLNDEAHHAWRPQAGERTGGNSRETLRATRWIEALDRLHGTVGIAHCYDFSATPFRPTGPRDSEKLFDWIVSDFGLNDAIESGLVKTPRVVVQDDRLPDPETGKSRFYHLFNDPEVKGKLTGSAKPDQPLPELVRQAYELLGEDWLKTANVWDEHQSETPPVMISVANLTRTSERIEKMFERKDIDNDRLCDPDQTLRIDSAALEKAEEAEIAATAIPGESGSSPKKLTQKQREQQLRLQVNTVGRLGEPGEKIQNVISVAMLSEGWDAKTVTHIMGLRAFTSQLLCEQVVGRGLRRTAYELNDQGMFEPEAVNVFGVPFAFLSQPEGPPPPPPKPTVKVYPLKERESTREITWPNVVQIICAYRPQLSLNLDEIEPLQLEKTATRAELAAIIEEQEHEAGRATIEMREARKEVRLQTVIFQVAREIYYQMKEDWEGDAVTLIGQVVVLVEKFLRSNLLLVVPSEPGDQYERQLAIKFQMEMVVQHIWSAIRYQNPEKLQIVVDKENPIGRTGDMRLWYTSKDYLDTKHSHINRCVCDSNLEKEAALLLDSTEDVVAWVKNDHLNFKIRYIHEGVEGRYLPDFLVRFRGGGTLVVEMKGQRTPQAEAKEAALKEWVAAVCADGGYGRWYCCMAMSLEELKSQLDHYAAEDSRQGSG